VSPRLDPQEEANLAAFLATMHDPDDADARRDSEIAAEVDAILARTAD
jgi:hypothetical protein